MPEFQTLVVPADWRAVLAGRNGAILTEQILPGFLARQRWYGDKEGLPTAVAFADRIELGAEPGGLVMVLLDVSRDWAEVQRYALPLAVAWETDRDDPSHRLSAHGLARVRRGSESGVLYDATASEALPRLLIEGARHGLTAETAAGGRLVFRSTAAFAPFADVTGDSCRRLGVEQSNTSLLVDDRIICKLYRRLQEGIHPEIEVGRFLTDVADYRNTPRLLGSVERQDPDGTVTAIALLQEFVRNQGDGWTLTLDHLNRVLCGAEAKPAPPVGDDDIHREYWPIVDALALGIGDLHRAFSVPSGDRAFEPEPVSQADVEAWSAEVATLAGQAHRALDGALHAGRLDGATRAMAANTLEHWADIERLGAFSGQALRATLKTRIHGDLHLGQVVVSGQDIFVLDFEGEPLRPLAARRAKLSPLRDVAGMVRSFDYAANAFLVRQDAVTSGRDGETDLGRAVALWRVEATRRFLAGYRSAVADCPSLPGDPDAFSRLLDALVTEKALYEICYEAANRPDWLWIPLAGLDRLLAARP